MSAKIVRKYSNARFPDYLGSFNAECSGRMSDAQILPKVWISVWKCRLKQAILTQLWCVEDYPWELPGLDLDRYIAGPFNMCAAGKRVGEKHKSQCNIYICIALHLAKILAIVHTLTINNVYIFAITKRLNVSLLKIYGTRIKKSWHGITGTNHSQV